MSTPIDLDPKEYVEILDLLKKIDFFQGVSEDVLKSLLFSIQKLTVNKDFKLIFQGEICNRLHIIRHGSVIITSKIKGNKFNLAELFPPSYFGEISLLRPTAATATVTAGDDGVELLILSNEVFENIQKKEPSMVEKIQAVIETRLAQRKKAQEADDSDGSNS